MKISLSKKEIEEIKKRINIHVGGEKFIPKIAVNYKNHISGIFFDEKERLWVEASYINNDSKKRGFDIFSNNIFINKVFIKANEEDTIYILKDKLFVLSEKEIVVFSII